MIGVDVYADRESKRAEKAGTNVCALVIHGLKDIIPRSWQAGGGEREEMRVCRNGGKIRVDVNARLCEQKSRQRKMKRGWIVM